MIRNTKLFSRRAFLQKSGIGMAAVPFMPFPDSFLSARPDDPELKVYLFSKHLQFLNYSDMSEAATEMGFDGLDLTVRPKGHVLPDRVTDDLPKAAEAMKKFGLQPHLMTTNVIDGSDFLSRTVLETAGRLGFKYYRTGWLSYPEDKSIPESIAAYAERFSVLETLNKKHGIIGAYQNHAGNHVGAPIWDMYEILKNTESKFIGAQYDIRHAVVEGGSSWELGLRLIKDYIRTIVIKDFKWGQEDGKWKPINVPLGEGMVDFERYFSLLKKYGINVPVSLHLEYDLGGAEHGAAQLTIDKGEVFLKMKKDLQFLREAWERAD